MSNISSLRCLQFIPQDYLRTLQSVSDYLIRESGQNYLLATGFLSATYVLSIILEICGQDKVKDRTKICKDKERKCPPCKEGITYTHLNAQCSYLYPKVKDISSIISFNSTIRILNFSSILSTFYFVHNILSNFCFRSDLNYPTFASLFGANFNTKLFI